jgi:hypothetical protein
MNMINQEFEIEMVEKGDRWVSAEIIKGGMIGKYIKTIKIFQLKD